MFSHIMVGANNIEKSKIYYDNLLGVLGAKKGVFVPNLTGQTRYFYFLEGMTFCISEPIDGEPASAGNGSTIGFNICLLYTSPSPRDRTRSRMPSSA